MRKKIFLVIIIWLLLFKCLISYASDNVTTTIKTNQEDKNITVTLKVEKIREGLDALSGKIEYDDSKLEFIEAKSANSNLQEPSFNINNGKFTILIKSNSIKTPADIIQFSFKIKENITGNTEIKILQLTGATESDKKIILEDSVANINIENNIPNIPNIPNNNNTNNEETNSKVDITTNNNGGSNNNNNNNKNTTPNNISIKKNEIVKDEVKPENNETTIEDNNGTEENNNIVNNIEENDNIVEIENTQNNIMNNNSNSLKETTETKKDSAKIGIYLYITIGIITIAIILIIIILIKNRKNN